MNYEDERYVRLYVRNTPTWCSWKWEARAVLPLLLRAVDRDGRLEWPGGDDTLSVAAVLMLPVKVVTVGLRELARTKTITLGEGWLEVPNFVPGQNARSSSASGAERTKRWKARVGYPTTRVERGVETRGDEASPVETRGDPQLSGAQPSPAQLVPPPTPASGGDELPANDLPGEESPGLLAACSPAPKRGSRRKPRADVDDALVQHVCDEMRRACRELTGSPNAGPEPGANGEPCSPTNRDHIAKCQAAHGATPEQWTRVIRAQLANVRANGKTQYLTLSTICGPANFQRLLDMPPPPTRIGARPEIGPRPTVARPLELKPRREEPAP